MPKSNKKKSSRTIVQPPPEQSPAPTDDQILASNLTLHELFQKQTSVMLDRADLSDEQKQSILIAMSCPCCGGGGFSFTAKLKRAK
jgi:hypothetical protein